MAAAPDAVISLPARCQLAALTELRSDLLRGLDAPAVVIDAGRLTHVDTAALQLLCAAALTASRDGVALTWRAVSPELRAAATALGLAADLGLPPLAEA